MKRQFTATVYILKEDQVLLIFHKKLKKWLPPGGHLEPNELPSEGALREAFEETGLRVELFREEQVWIENNWNSRSFERPFMCLLEEIPEMPSEPAHQHVDFVYVGYPIGGTELWNHVETEGLRWFSLEDIESLEVDKEIFRDTIEAIRKIIGSKFVPLHPECVVE